MKLSISFVIHLFWSVVRRANSVDIRGAASSSLRASLQRNASEALNKKGAASSSLRASLQRNASEALNKQGSHVANLSADESAKRVIDNDHHWKDLVADRDEHRIDTLTWRLGRPPHFHGLTPPPKCPRDIAWNAQYWYNTAYPDKSHTICKYADNCERVVSNQYRLHAIRNVLEVTKSILDADNIPYILYGGTAIGQARCKDVLAWDNDCDVVVKRSDLHRLSSGHVPEGYELMQFTTVIPYKVVDKSTGFYCDIFIMDIEEHTSKVAIPWPYASELCPQFPDTPQSPGPTQHCYRHDLDVVFPLSSCEVNGVMHTCAGNQDAFLVDTFGAGWRTPNVSTASR